MKNKKHSVSDVVKCNKNQVEFSGTITSVMPEAQFEITMADGSIRTIDEAHITEVISERRYVIQSIFIQDGEIVPMYYNSAHYSMHGAIRDATRYRSEESAAADLSYVAENAGGKTTVQPVDQLEHNYSLKLLNSLPEIKDSVPP